MSASAVTRWAASRMSSSATYPPIEMPAKANRGGVSASNRPAMAEMLASCVTSANTTVRSAWKRSACAPNTVEVQFSPGMKTRGVAIKRKCLNFSVRSAGGRTITELT